MKEKLVRNDIIAIVLMVFLVETQSVTALEIQDGVIDLALENELSWLKAESIIEVVSKQKENKNAAAGIVSVVTADEIERYGAANLHDILGRVTSIYALGSHTFFDNAVSMRGDLLTHINNHTLLLINGRPFRESIFSGLNESIYRDFPIYNIDRIEVIRGPGSVLYGTNAYSGVINIVTKSAKKNALTVRGRYGSYHSGQLESEFSYKNQDFSATGAVRYQTSDGWKFSGVGEDKQPSAFRYDAADISANVWAQWQGFTLNGFVASNQHQHWGARPLGNGQLTENERLFFDIGYQYRFNSNWHSQTNLTYNYFTNTFDIITPYHYDSHSVLAEHSQQANFFNDKLTVLAGGLVEWQTGVVSWQNRQDAVPRYANLVTSFYAEANYKILDNLKFNIGGQWNRVNYYKSKAIPLMLSTERQKDFQQGKVGRVGLVYQINSEWGAKLLYSQAFRSPTSGELTINIPTVLLGNNTLQSEHVDTVDLQLFYQDKTYQGSLTGFRSRMAHLINRVGVTNSTTTRYENETSAVFAGVEFEGKAKLANWQLTTAYTFQTNRDGNGKNNLSVAPNHIVKLGASYDVTDNLQISVFDNFFSQPKAVQGAEIVNPIPQSYHYVTANLRYRLNNLFGLNGKNKPVTFSLYMDNVLDEKIYYPEFNRKLINSIPGKQGRSLYGEIKLEF